MKAAPFLLIFLILLGGIVIAYQTVNSAPEEPNTVDRPTVTPRPRPTLPVKEAGSVPTVGLPAGTGRGVAAQPTATSPQTAASQPSVATQPSPTAPAQVVPSPTSPPGPAATATAAPTTPPTSTPVATAAPSPSPTAGAAPSPSPTAGQTLRVGNTDRLGVFIRRTPRMDDKIRPWMDGTPMMVVGPPEDGDGHQWQHVRAPDGAEGYIPAEFLLGG